MSIRQSWERTKKTYTVKDSAGNETTVTRTVVVRNQTSSTSSSCGGEPGVIYLTFDDGPNAYYTPVILDVLKKYNVKATFFATMAGPDSLIKKESMKKDMPLDFIPQRTNINCIWFGRFLFQRLKSSIGPCLPNYRNAF